MSTIASATYKNHEINESSRIPSRLREDPVEVAQLREILLNMRDILNTSPRNWHFNLEEKMRGLLADCANEPGPYHPTLSHFIRTELPAVLEMFESHVNERRGKIQHLVPPSMVIDRAITLFEKVSEHFLERIGYRPPQLPAQLINYEIMEILSDGKISLSVGSDGARKLIINLGDSPEQNFEVPVPNSENVVLKGGPARAILKIVAGASDELIQSEFPLNDIDAMVRISVPDAIHEAMSLGADREGVEGVEDPFASENLVNRDITLNSCALTSKGLIFTAEAHRDAQTGQAVPLDSDRGLFGRNNFHHEGIVLVQPRCMFRLIKFLAEEKASFVELYPRNFEVDLGVYVLTLGRKLATKQDGPMLFARTFDLLEQIGQVRSGENNMFDVLNRVHSEHPYFDFDSTKLDRQGVAEWLSRKVDKFIVRSFRNLESIKSENTIPVSKGDDVPVRIALSPEDVRPMNALTHARLYERFLSDSSQRTRQYREENPNDKF